MSIFKNLPIALDITNLSPDVSIEEINNRKPIIDVYDNLLRYGKCLGNDFCGWVHPKEILSSNELENIKATVKRLKKESDYLVVIGIGGSYLGARAVIEALSLEPEKVLYAGQNISSHYLNDLKNKLTGKKVAINVVSKSGTTTEPAMALRILKEIVKSSEKSLLVATTDAHKGSLLDFAKGLDIDTFVVPDNIGGRYSVLSAVGILPILYAGIDVDMLIKGANDCAKLCSNPDPMKNPAYAYASIRNILSAKGYAIEILSSFEPRLFYFAEWWKQLFGESEGKDGVGLFPASCSFSTDLHSLGQFIQDGKRNLFEMFLIISDGEPSLKIPEWEKDLDGLNYLAGVEVSFVNNMAYEATAKAHRDGKVPNATIKLKELNSYSLGALIYFYEIACAMTCLMNGINPFDQPGVEAYKKYMFMMLGKPSYEKLNIDNSNNKCIVF